MVACIEIHPLLAERRSAYSVEKAQSALGESSWHQDDGTSPNREVRQPAFRAKHEGTSSKVLQMPLQKVHLVAHY